MSWMLGPDSTSKGVTIPGNTTMSDNPNTGSASGNDREEIRDGAPASRATSWMLTYSVSVDSLGMDISWDSLTSLRPARFICRSARPPR
jgi:hypothetical protein